MQSGLKLEIIAAIVAVFIVTIWRKEWTEAFYYSFYA